MDNRKPYVVRMPFEIRGVHVNMHFASDIHFAPTNVRLTLNVCRLNFCDSTPLEQVRQPSAAFCPIEHVESMTEPIGVSERTL